MMILDGSIEFKIHDKHYSVGNEIAPDTTLNDYIRNYVNLKGTKFMCLEGGCGACIITAKKVHPATKKEIIFSVNSCLVPIFVCHGWSMTTVEGIGNKTNGYDKLQTSLAAYNGSQCGYCSPGMVMSMYSVMSANGGKITTRDVEDAFSGNICRCTGYRAILDAYQSLATNGPPHLKQKLVDIEDLTKKWCKMKDSHYGDTGNGKRKMFDRIISSKSFRLKLNGGITWYRVTTVDQIVEVFDTLDENQTYTLVAGNTAHGVYRTEDVGDVHIDINDIPELHQYAQSGGNLVLGANVTLTDAIAIFRSVSSSNSDQFGYLAVLADHVQLIANTPVRNIGTLAGNLSIKHNHRDFASDIFTMLESINAQLTILDKNGITNVYALQEYLELDMTFKVIRNIIVPPFSSSNYVYGSYKIMQRAQNTSAYVNATFVIKVNKSQNYKVIDQPSLVFGGINPSFIHASATESYLNGKSLLDSNTLKVACMKMFAEVDPDVNPPRASPQYRRILSVSLFYKFVLGLSPKSVSTRNQSGAALLQRPVSTGSEDVTTDKTEWPLTQPIPKMDAVLQCSGEAEYTNDIPAYPTELHAAFVICDRGPGKISSVDASEALNIPGVVKFLSAKDIPGQNKLQTMDGRIEMLFSTDNVPCAGMRIGVIIATSPQLAREAAAKVKVVIAMSGKPIINLKNLVTSGPKDRLQLQQQIKAKTKKTDVKYKFSGVYETDGQYHFQLETQTCLTVPNDLGLNVYCASQRMTSVQETISTLLKIPQNEINVQVKRVGGAFGGKISNGTRTAAACALAAFCMNCPVRMVVSLETCMEALAKRAPFYAQYEVGVNAKGEIQYLNTDVYTDTGLVQTDPVVPLLLAAMQNNYNIDTWNINQYAAYTDLPANTTMRAPGGTEAISLQEHIMERIAAVTNQNPIDVRIANLKSTDLAAVTSMMNDVKQSSDLENRITNIETYNKANRWKKKGIALSYMSFPYNYMGPYHIIISVYAGDGTVAITHGGIEFGQGINTKAAQVCARILGIDVNMIRVKPVNSITAPNDMVSAGDAPTFGVCYAAQQCSNMLVERLKPYRTPSRSWQDVITAANNDQVDLCVEYMFATNNMNGLRNYNIYGVTVSEVEVDILTGQQQIVRVDLLEDAGRSINPELDIGQVQGAFIMGLGYWLMERLVYDENTGMILTNRTWNYTPPTNKDIPVDFRVMFRKNAPNPLGVLRAKATGEPSLSMAVSVTIAIKNALLSARKDAGSKDNWFNFDMPYTPENILLNSMTTVDQFTL